MRQLICRRTCEWVEIGYIYKAVRISYLVRLAEVAHIHIGYCKITTCYRARPDKRAQRCSISSIEICVCVRVCVPQPVIKNNSLYIHTYIHTYIYTFLFSFLPSVFSYLLCTSSHLPSLPSFLPPSLPF